jgi:hypothetical protein
MQFSRRRALAGVAAAVAQSNLMLQGQVPTRSFRMGFTPFPPSPTFEDWTKSFQTILKHGDLVALFIQDGIPWEAALADAPLSKYPQSIREFLEFQNTMVQRIVPQHSRYIAFNPTSVDYTQLAANWEDQTNGPLPYPWNTFDFDHPSVKQAALNYLKVLVNTFNPSYLNIGIETNILLARNYEHWPAYLELHQFLYTEIKKLHPKLTVMVSVQYEHLLGLHQDSLQLQRKYASTYPNILTAEVAKLLRYSDMLAVSTYPYMIERNVITERYFDTAARMAGEAKIALSIDQTGYTSSPLQIGNVVLPGDETLQFQYTSFILSEAQRLNMKFVVNFVPIDYETSFGVDPVALSWAYTGLYRKNGNPKAALSIWEAFYGRRLQS